MNLIKKSLFNGLKLLRGLEISYPTFRCRGGHLPPRRAEFLAPPDYLALRGAGLTFNIFFVFTPLPLHSNARSHTVFEREIL